MLSAVVGDYLAVEGVDVDISWDRRLDESCLPDDICGHHRLACLPVSSAQQHDLTFQRLASDADAVLLIAPEFEGILLDRVRQAVAVGAQLISPGEALVREASDKLVMARRLDREGVPVPCTALLEPQENWPEDITFPAVIKPVDGAGSQDIFEVQDLGQVNGLPAWSGKHDRTGPYGRHPCERGDLMWSGHTGAPAARRAASERRRAIWLSRRSSADR